MKRYGKFPSSKAVSESFDVNHGVFFFFFFFFFIALFGSSIACPLVFSVLHLSYQDEEFVINY